MFKRNTSRQSMLGQNKRYRPQIEWSQRSGENMVSGDMGGGQLGASHVLNWVPEDGRHSGK